MKDRIKDPDYSTIDPKDAFYVYRLNHDGWNNHNKTWDDVPNHVEYTPGEILIEPKLSHEFDKEIEKQLRKLDEEDK
jgi:hypothetical protein